ncbi:hypothetical protein C8J57DRAFT_1410380 [Mycena rebaudengoi]|nr:hypothetical protein C8J57DRAFT_1410380 [Mycena rebaudengoi]
MAGRYKEGKCVEKWGPGPLGPGTVCDRCRKKMKRVERRGTLEQQLQHAAPGATTAPSTPAGSPYRTPPVHRADTLPSATAPFREQPQESSMRSSLVEGGAAAAATGRVIKSRLTPVPVAPTPVAAAQHHATHAPGLLPPLRTHSPMEVDEGDLDADAEADADAEEVDEIDADAEGERVGGADADGDGEAEGGDPEADLLEAVDAAEAASNSNSSGGRGGRMKSED